MSRWLRVGALSGVLLAVGLIVSCDAEPGMDVTTGAELRVTVTSDGQGLSGVTVDLFASGGTSVLETKTTGGSGEARFTGLDAGTYEVEITVPAGHSVDGDGPTRQTVMVPEDGEGTATFTLVSDDPPGDVVEVHMTSSLTFSPSQLTVEPGTTVRWINDASIFHTITPDGHTEWSEGTVSSSGDTFSHTFQTEGTFPYYCSPHRSQGMTGTVTVEAP